MEGGQRFAGALMFFELFGINRAEPEHADRNFVFCPSEKAKIFRAHNRLGGGGSLFAEPILEDSQKTACEFGIVVGRGCGFIADGNSRVAVLRDSGSLGQTTRD